MDDLDLTQPNSFSSLPEIWLATSRSPLWIISFVAGCTFFVFLQLMGEEMFFSLATDNASPVSNEEKQFGGHIRSAIHSVLVSVGCAMLFWNFGVDLSRVLESDEWANSSSVLIVGFKLLSIVSSANYLISLYYDLCLCGAASKWRKVQRVTAWLQHLLALLNVSQLFVVEARCVLIVFFCMSTETLS